jgi:hypothetical protein
VKVVSDALSTGGKLAGDRLQGMPSSARRTFRRPAWVTGTSMTVLNGLVSERTLGLRRDVRRR